MIQLSSIIPSVVGGMRAAIDSMYLWEKRDSARASKNHRDEYTGGNCVEEATSGGRRVEEKGRGRRRSHLYASSVTQGIGF